MEIKLYHILAFIAIFQSLFLAFFLALNSKVKSAGNYLLAMFFFSFSIVAFSALACSAYIWPYFKDYHKLIFLGSQLALLAGPLLFLCLKSFTTPGFHLQPKQLLHLIPFVLFTTIIAIILVPVNDFAIPNSNLRFYSCFLILGQSLCYIVLSIREIVKNNKLNRKSSLTKQTWSYMLIGGLSLFWIAKFNAFVLIDMEKVAGICPFTSSTYSVSIFIFLIAFFYYTMSNPELLFKPRQYKSSKLDENLKNEIIKKLNYYIQSKKPHLDPEITLSVLANQLDITSRQLSQVLNEKIHRNFYEFINYQRIEESKQLLTRSSKDEKNISEIFYQVGFNSRSSFNIEFKKLTGLTPTEYRNSFFSKKVFENMN